MIRALAFVSLVASLLAAPQAIVLDNTRLSARFGDRGLESIAAGPLGTYRFDRDDFTIAIDGRSYDSAALASPARTSAKDRVTYSWIAGTYRIDVIFFENVEAEYTVDLAKDQM